MLLARMLNWSHETGRTLHCLFAVIVRVLVYLKLDPVRITCQKRFFGLNVIIRVSVKEKSLVAILLLGHNVATAIFQNGCQIQYPPILTNTACRAIIVVCESIF